MSEYLEIVNWDRRKIEEAAFGVIGWYAKSLAPLGTKPWVRFAVQNMLPLIRGESAETVELEGEGFYLVFHGPNPGGKPIASGMHNGSIKDIVWQESEPRFVFYDSSLGVLMPGVRTRLYRTNEAIADEATKVYGLAVGSDPFKLVFTKTGYAASVTRTEASVPNFSLLVGKRQ